MITYHYTAKDPASGKTVKADVEADSEKSALNLIKRQGYTPISIKARGEGFGGIATAAFRRIPAKDKVLFTRQLSTLINAGLPLVQSLRNVNDQTTNKALREVVNKVIVDVESGATLSAAMSKHPKVFNQVYTSLVAAGEVSGTLDKALERIANQQEKDAEIVSKVKGAMTYPLVVVGVMVLVVGFMMLKVMPQVKVLYDGFAGAELPIITKIMLGASAFTVKFWWLFVVLVIAGVVFSTRWARTMGGKRVIDKLKMRAWPFGPLFMKVYMARFARTGTTLVASGVPLLQVLDITSDAVNNVYLSDSIHRAADKVKGGKSLSESITGDPNFLPLVPNMLGIGEASGAMEDMLAKVADYYEKEVDDQIRTISSIVEPLLMVILGIVAFAIVAAVLLPIYGLAGQSFI